LRDGTATTGLRRLVASRAALASAIAVLLAGAPLAIVHEIGPLSHHMVLHIMTMNVVAPLAAALVVATATRRTAAPRRLWLIAVAQILALHFLHTPRFHAMAAHAPAFSLAVHGLLAALAFAFWTALLRLDDRHLWHAPATLLVTAKLACLLAALLIFSPRPLYAGIDHAGHANLADQQLAGLLMVVACPLSYLTAAILLTIDLIRTPDVGDAQVERHAP
jgi:putative membrane protein